MRNAIAIIALLFSSNLQAQQELPPLSFAGIDESTIPTKSSDFTCKVVTDKYTKCLLKRSSYGGVPIDRSDVFLNENDGTVSGLWLTSSAVFDSIALKALEAKYGKPDVATVKKEINKTGGPYAVKTFIWRKFAKKAHISLTVNLSDSDNMILIVSFPTRKVSNAPVVDF